ncbi:SAM-dependent methyltransferase [Thermopolyspora sp. NPDC052614]|uniref:SAM-dependent methyltransferase n=1 Tax=Thermopolyspora sp. NPDC052614 TaxID=3155682 RepID=UPI0034394F37
MTETPQIDPSTPHSARVWNYWLGGKDNYPSDREVGDQIAGFFPDIIDSARADRAFLGRAVRYLAGEVGIRQFLDIGTGLPTADNTHEVAQRVAPESRVVYVDNDPLVLIHAEALLTSTPPGVTEYIQADIHDPGTILREAAKTLDFDRPVGLMLLAIVQFILDDDEAAQVMRRLIDALAPGSHVAISHGTNEINTEASDAAVAYWNQYAKPPMVLRDARQIAKLLDGLELLEPGVVSCSRWRPEAIPWGEPTPVPHYCAVARKN